MKYFDNTRVSTYKKCPRKFYFRHRRHFVGTGKEAALSFGGSWHEGMDVIWSLLSSVDDRRVVELAYGAFLNKWLEEGMPDPDDLSAMTDLAPRTPGIAREMFWNYLQTRRQYIEESELIACELPFAVPIYPDNAEIMYIGRLDKVVRHEGRIKGIEHKTTSLYSKEYGIRQSYLDTYSPNAQVDGYLHALHMLYGEEAKSVMVDISLVHKQHHDVFKLLPIEKQFTMVDVWLRETQGWIDRIMKDDWLLEKDKQNGTMYSFPKNDSACFDFGRTCTYRDLCAYIPNPIDMECPMGMKEEKWEPFDVLQLEKIGLGPEE